MPSTGATTPDSEHLVDPLDGVKIDTTSKINGALNLAATEHISSRGSTTTSPAAGPSKSGTPATIILATVAPVQEFESASSRQQAQKNEESAHPLDPLMRVYDISKDSALTLEELLARPRPATKVLRDKLNHEIAVQTELARKKERFETEKAELRKLAAEMKQLKF
jgi:hypothetical protein